jgi:hypothetical protein
MLMDKAVLSVLLAGALTALLSLLGWQASTLIDVDKRTERTALKVDENYRMIKPMWEQFIQSRNVVRADGKSSDKPQTR